MKVHGNVDMQQNQLLQPALSVESTFPANPVPGRLLFMNKILYICVEISAGTPVWIPLTSELNSVQHAQTTAAKVWTITHNLKTTTPAVFVYDGASNASVIPDTIETVDVNTVRITFANDMAGRAVVMIGNLNGVARQEVAYMHYQTTPSATWDVVHSLGRNPIVRVFIGQNEVQPASITHNSVNEVTITFSTPQVGTVRCI